MHADQLYVVTPYSNPLRTQSRPRLAKAFCAHMIDSGVNLVLVECQLGKRPFELEGHIDPRVTYIGVRHSTIVWHKESLINIGLSRLPSSAEYVAWVDADITFLSPTWAADTVHALQQYSVVQPWQNAYDLGPYNEHLELHTSFASLFVHGRPIFPQWKAGYTFGHPGYAWAYRRSVLEEVGGLFDKAALGSSDHNMALALIGRASETFPNNISPQFTESVMAWQAKAKHFFGERIGFVPGRLEHTWHGPKAKRAYVSRWSILQRWKFNPVLDLKYNFQGVLELAGNKLGLQKDIESYFAARDEDANTNA